ncbi:MAG: carbon storage regulator [Planctomycetaceae bacterium]|jgi:carbon storage regulator|nr:carbon storage regulator [Planctomycetaceae bacterium]
MLVLTRKEGEKIHIGDDITITVVRNGSDRVRLGIDAPAELVVLRGELRKNRPDHETEQEIAVSLPLGRERETARCG